MAELSAADTGHSTVTASASASASAASDVSGAGAERRPTARGITRKAAAVDDDDDGDGDDERGGQGRQPGKGGATPTACASTSTSIPPRPTAAEAYEQAHVHGVYEAIAPHFSATRYRPWPLVAAFLRAQPPGSVGLDVGCGNGKYLAVNRDVALVGSDRSAALVAFARAQTTRTVTPKEEAGEGEEGARCGAGVGAPGADVLVADGLALPFRPRAADFAICIAVVHHLSTRERRVTGIRELLDCVRFPAGGPGGGSDDVDDGGKIMVYVWALEQGTSRRGWDDGADQDQLVPWVLKTQPGARGERKEKGGGSKDGKKDKKKSGKGRATGSGGRAVGEAAGPADSGQVGEGGAAGDEERGEEERNDRGEDKREGDKTFHRFYHLYRKGELEEDVVAAGGRVLDSGYEKDNWWAIAAHNT